MELHAGQTLAIAGLLQLTLDGQTSRIPGLGDLPILGPFFSNTSSNRVEKELLVLVTPYLVEPMNADQVPPGPGDEVYGCRPGQSHDRRPELYGELTRPQADAFEYHYERRGLATWRTEYDKLKGGHDER